MKILLTLLLLLASLGVAAEDFWLRDPYACTDANGVRIQGNGKAYACATTAGGTGAWLTDRNVNVNTGKWGDTSATVGAGDRIFICGRYDLPLTGYTLRDFLYTGSTITWNVANPMEINVGCPAGVTNGPTVADPAKVDFLEDYRSRTWTNVSGNVWSTPNDYAFAYSMYLACGTPENLGIEVDSGNRAGYGVDMPAAYCEFDSLADSMTKLYVYSEGNPSTYYTALYASSKNFLLVTNPKGVRIVGDTTTSNYNLIRGGSYFTHLAYAVYLGSFSSATDYTSFFVAGLYCEYLAACVHHDGQSTSTYYPRGLYLFRNGCYFLSRGCIQLSGKFGTNTEIAYNWSKNSNQSYSAGAFYFGGGMDRATHPNEEPKTMHHNFVDGVGWAHYWIYDGYGIYIEEGDKGVKAYANWVQNLNGNGQACFHSNSAYAGNSHESSVCLNSNVLAKSSDSAGNGNVSVQFINLTGINISGTALSMSGQAGDSPVFRNILAVATPTNSAGLVASHGSALTPTFQSINPVGFAVADYYNGTTTAALSGETKHAPQFISGDYPTTPMGACLKSTSQLLTAGTRIGPHIRGYDGSTLGPVIGALGLCKGYDAVPRTISAGRTYVR